MRLPLTGAPHLTYCTNIHPGETWPEVRANLERHVTAVKRQVAPRTPFGVGLRLSARAAEELAAPPALDDLRGLLAAHDLYVFTINGFPYGRFHGTAVKEQVYLPDWRDDARLAYSDRLASLLAALLPDGGVEGSVSTVPGAFKPRLRSHADVDAMVERLVRHAAHLVALDERAGKTIALALEPEPCCHLETVADTVAFFEDRLFARAARARLGQLTGLGATESEARLRAHLGVCLDACHMAVEYEDPAAALAALARAGIRVAKIQISAGLEVALADGAAPGRGGGRLAALGAFADDVYLHQVVERLPDGELVRYADLPEALAAAGAASGRGARRWRVHFHVPLAHARLGPFATTQPWVRALLERVRRDSPTRHLEVETYTWNVLPAEHRRTDVVDAVAQELRWVREQLGAGADDPTPAAGARPGAA